MLNLREGRAFCEPSFDVECAFKFLLVSVGVLTGSLVPLVISFVRSGIVIVVLEGLDLDIGKPRVEGGQALVASTKGGKTVHVD